jgi:hypothetical protein
METLKRQGRKLFYRDGGAKQSALRFTPQTFSSISHGQGGQEHRYPTNLCNYALRDFDSSSSGPTFSFPLCERLLPDKA